MMELKKTTKYDCKLKSLHFEGNTLLDADGVVIDIVKHLQAAYEDKFFDLSMTSKVEVIEEIEVEIDEE